jgi:hypothetical protein
MILGAGLGVIEASYQCSPCAAHLLLFGLVFLALSCLSTPFLWERPWVPWVAQTPLVLRGSQRHRLTSLIQIHGQNYDFHEIVQTVLDVFGGQILTDTLAETPPSLNQSLLHLSAAVGLSVWQPRIRAGSFLLFELGPARPDRKFGVKGQFHLSILHCAWRLERGSEVLAFCEEPTKVLDQSVRLLDGLRLEKISVDPISLSSEFSFSEDVRLLTFSMYREEYEHWIMFGPWENAFVAGPGSSFSWEK